MKSLTHNVQCLPFHLRVCMFVWQCCIACMSVQAKRAVHVAGHIDLYVDSILSITLYAMTVINLSFNLNCVNWLYVIEWAKPSPKALNFKCRNCGCRGNLFNHSSVTWFAVSICAPLLLSPNSPIFGCAECMHRVSHAKWSSIRLCEFSRSVRQLVGNGSASGGPIIDTSHCVQYFLCNATVNNKWNVFTRLWPSHYPKNDSIKPINNDRLSVGRAHEREPLLIAPKINAMWQDKLRFACAHKHTQKAAYSTYVWKWKENMA